MLRDAAARQGVELIELDGKNLDEALARKESTGYSDCEGYVCFREDYMSDAGFGYRCSGDPVLPGSG
ncbi:hypothetical protein ACL1C9_07935 [Corynebacterium striatum]